MKKKAVQSASGVATKADIQMLKTDTQMLKTDVQVLKADVQVLKADNQTLKSDLTGTNLKIDELKRYMDQKQAETHHFFLVTNEQLIHDYNGIFNDRTEQHHEYHCPKMSMSLLRCTRWTLRRPLIIF